jgi:hypothetical protein
MAGRGDKDLVLEGRKRVRRRKPDCRSWTKAKEKLFLTALGDSCNVKLAARKAGVSTSNIYLRRARNAGFRAAWARALAIGYAQLEMMMLERALHGVEKTVVVGGETRTIREYSDRVGLTLLRMHRDTVGEAEEQRDPSEARDAAERIIARLARIREQAEAAGAPQQ